MASKPPSKRRRIMLRLALLAVMPPLLLLVWVATGALESSRPADCIFVPGAAIRPGRKPSDALEFRLQAALELYQQGRAPRIVVSGGGEGDYAEAEVMREWLIKRGVPEGAILAETTSKTTRENAAFSAPLLRQHGIRSALVCTQWFHVRRTCVCLGQEGITAHAAPCGGRVLTRTPWFVARELAALPIYTLRLDSRFRAVAR